MDNKKLSQLYFMFCERMHVETTNLYESLHDYAGDAVEREDLVRHLCSNFTLRMRSEIDGIKSSCKEFNE
jgi:hypothetical protein